MTPATSKRLRHVLNRTPPTTAMIVIRTALPAAENNSEQVSGAGNRYTETGESGSKDASRLSFKIKLAPDQSVRSTPQSQAPAQRDHQLTHNPQLGISVHQHPC